MKSHFALYAIPERFQRYNLLLTRCCSFSHFVEQPVVATADTSAKLLHQVLLVVNPNNDF